MLTFQTEEKIETVAIPNGHLQNARLAREQHDFDEAEALGHAAENVGRSTARIASWLACETRHGWASAMLKRLGRSDRPASLGALAAGQAGRLQFDIYLGPV